ncbi:MAG: PPC domain-containing DNA-binding protein [Anaerolineaceae bacterium]|jgi:predicted DNA-binding protein with PD1-like motif|nr:PPC domain-containing DNA-binding protein [Anaerolineaceae bacterium]
MRTFAFRLPPLSDLQPSLEEFTRVHHIQAGCILSCVGNLDQAAIQMADQVEPTILQGPFEIVSLAGTLSPDGNHLHISFADSIGQTYGGHLREGTLVFTSAELVLADFDELRFHRIPDPETGSDELVVKPGDFSNQDQ